MKNRLKIVGREVLNKGNDFFSLDQITYATKINHVHARIVLERLCREKIVKILRIIPRPVKPTWEKGRPAIRITYRLINKKALEHKVAPKLKADTSQDRIWKVIRYKGHFTANDLIILANAKKENVRWFMKMLRRAGIIEPERNGGPGVAWRLLKDAGPQRPYVGDMKKVRSSEL